MRRWHISKDWYLVWGVTFIIGGLILYIGYLSSISDISMEKPQSMTNESAQAVTAVPSYLETNDTSKQQIVTEPKEQTNSMGKKREFEEDLELVFGKGDLIKHTIELKDLPSPVHGDPIRSVGNYYSEAYKDYIFHAGLDYALTEGTVIRATHGGNVIFAGEDPILGKKVTIDCGEGWLVTYGGLDNLRVQKGEVIDTQGALGQIGYFPGAEGASNQPQLHYEVWHYGQVQRLEP